MIIFLIIRDLSINKYQNVEYVIFFIYIINRNDVDNNVRTCFRRETHVVDDLKINIFIENNVINVENFFINFQKKIVYVKKCKIIIFIEIKFFKTFIVQRSIYLKKIITIFSYAKLVIFIHLLNNNFSHFRNFLFESKKIYHVFMYVRLINVFIEIVIIRNNNDRLIQISRNIRLKKIFELKYFNVFLTNFENNVDVQKLTIRQSIFVHKKKWFRKIINIYVIVFVVVVATKTIVDSRTLRNKLIIFETSIITTISWKLFSKFFCDFKSIEIRLFNEITIYDFDKKNVDFFRQIVNDFSILWIDTNFVEMSKIDWIKISLKIDWEFKVFDKIKIYFLKIRNHRLINETFNEFHESSKLFWTMNSISFNYLVFCVWKKIFFDERKNQVVVDIRDFNVITQSNVYSILLQIDVILAIRNCFYIIVVNCVVFFYQWRVHLFDRYKLIVVNHKSQKIFNVIVMSYKIFFVYVQKQINRFLKLYRVYIKTYVNNIVIFSKILKKHEQYFR